MRKILMSLICLGFATDGIAQEKLTYQKPSKEILNLVDVERAPYSIIDSKGEMMVFLYRDAYKNIAELSEEELRLGGLRINPATNIGSRVTYYNNLKVKPLLGNEPKQVTGLPQNPKFANFVWSPDETKMAFTHTTDSGVELWVVDLKTNAARKLTDATLNANMGRPMRRTARIRTCCRTVQMSIISSS